MAWDIEYTDEFGEWWHSLLDSEKEDVVATITLLEDKGTQLPFPFSSKVEGSKHSHMRELRIQSGSDPLRILYAFDPRRTVILLIGGNKRGDKRWYEKYVPIADKLYKTYLEELKKERIL